MSEPLDRPVSGAFKRSALMLIPLISISVALLIAEGVLRYVYAPSSLVFRMKLQREQGPDNGTDAVLSFDSENLKFTPGHKATITHAEYVTHVSIDAYGYRNACPNRSPAQTLLVGDSFVFGIGVDDSATLQCLLNDSRPTYAMGIPGAGPTEYARMLEKQFGSLVGHALVANDARVVVVLFAGNDFEDLAAGPHVVQRPQAPRNAGGGYVRRFVQRLNPLVFRDWPTKDSYLLNLIKMVAMKRSTRTSESPDFLRLNTGSTLYRAQIPAQRRNELVEGASSTFRHIDALGRSLGASQVSYLLIPDVHEIDRERAVGGLSLYGEQPSNFALSLKEEVVLEAARRSGTTVVDAYGCFGTSGAGAFFYFLDNHLNARGTRRLIDCVRDRLN